MDWKILLAYITGLVDEALLLRNEYLVEENANDREGPIQCHKRVGGLLKFYNRQAA